MYIVGDIVDYARTIELAEAGERFPAGKRAATILFLFDALTWIAFDEAGHLATSN